jgi:hypothetical protein
VLLVFGAPCQRNLLAGQEHGRTIPLADQPRSSLSVNRDNESPGAPARYPTILRTADNRANALVGL